jgi:hypothetical protein
MHRMLMRIPKGQGAGWQVFESFTAHLFKKLFAPEHIDRPMVQVSSPNPVHRRDIILPVTATAGFWQILVFLHQGDLILVECKNYDGPIGQDEIQTTSKYFRRPGLSRLAFVVTRNGMNAPAQQAVREIYQIDGNFMCVLDDTHLHSLIDCLNDRQAAVARLRTIYQAQKAAV